jgi:hypothetical protein
MPLDTDNFDSRNRGHAYMGSPGFAISALVDSFPISYTEFCQGSYSFNLEDIFIIMAGRLVSATLAAATRFML